jgi:hypothetical protein
VPFRATGPARSLWRRFHAPGCIRVSEKTSSRRLDKWSKSTANGRKPTAYNRTQVYILAFPFMIHSCLREIVGIGGT